MTTTLYPARRIVTMNPNRPEAACVAVREGRILGVGTREELAQWGEYQVDERFADKVLLPGFVEGHCHLMQGTMWRFVYVGCHDRMDPEGRVWPGARTMQAIIERLKSAEASLGDPAAPLVGWGFDPVTLGGSRCTREVLDAVSTQRGVLLLHASLHVMSTNTSALQTGSLFRQGIEHAGIPLGHDGLPLGELRGPDAMWPVAALAGLDRSLLVADEVGMRAFGRLCVRTGVTTAADLANPFPPGALEMMLRVTDEPDYPTRIVSMLRLGAQSPADVVQAAVQMKAQSIDRLHLGFIKVVTDGSLQGLTSRLRWPGHFNGAPNGLWYIAPEALRELFVHALRAGVRVHIHTNGDQATDLALDCMRDALAQAPAFDHRFTIQHGQLCSESQFRRMRALGLCANLFANHVYYWGDVHYEQTLGPERAERINACVSARDAGVPFAIHSDAPVTPLSPLFTAWCAVNRLTSSGRLLGAAQRLSVAEALQAMTLGAAYTLGLDQEIGSIEAGKRADFAVLEDDPLACEPLALKDVRVWGVVQGGAVFQAPPAS